MTTGSGTNLKMLDYAAAGLLIVSTPFGGRGGFLQADIDFIASEIESLPMVLNQLTEQGIEPYRSLMVHARYVVEQRADWKILAADLVRVLSKVIARHAN
jgi:hypothetical protein